MTNIQWQKIINLLAKNSNVKFEVGLTSLEIASIEQNFGLRLPPDLAEFLQTALPVSKGFPNWRNDSFESLQDRINMPCEGILFDVEYNDFWLPNWGERPAKIDDALEKSRSIINNAPKLIPVYGHRMMPESPNEIGNPIFSVH